MAGPHVIGTGGFSRKAVTAALPAIRAGQAALSNAAENSAVNITRGRFWRTLRPAGGAAPQVDWNLSELEFNASGAVGGRRAFQSREVLQNNDRIHVTGPLNNTWPPPYASELTYTTLFGGLDQVRVKLNSIGYFPNVAPSAAMTRCTNL